MNIDKTSQPTTKAKALDKTGQLSQALQCASKESIDQFQKCFLGKPSFLNSNSERANSERNNPALHETPRNQCESTKSNFVEYTKSQSEVNKSDLPASKNSTPKAEPSISKSANSAEEKQRSKDEIGAMAVEESKLAKTAKQTKSTNQDSSSESSLVDKNRHLKMESTERRKPDTVKSDTQINERSASALDTSDTTQPAVDISEQLLMARLDLNPFFQQNLTVSSTALSPHPGTTDLSARITEAEEVKALINKYVSQLLVESKADARQEPGHLMMRMGENLENMDLMISKNKYGDWQLRCSCPNQNTANWMQRMSKSLVKRFAEKDLGVLKIDVELV